MSLENQRLLRILSLFFLLLAFLYFIYLNERNNHYRQKIPDEIPVGKVVAIGSEIGGFWDSCGAAIFQMAAPEDARFRHLEYFSNNRTLRMQDGQEQAGWNATPFRETGDGLSLDDRWPSGLLCAGLDEELSGTIWRALASPGSYYRQLGSGGVVVIPSAQLVAYVYFG